MMEQRSFVQFLKTFWPVYLIGGYRLFVSMRDNEMDVLQLFIVLAVAVVGNYLVFLVWRKFSSKKSALTNSAQVQLTEASTNFDIENVRPFLTRVSKFVSEGFGEKEIAVVCEQMQKMHFDNEKEWTFDVQYAGVPSPLKISVFMDDVESPDFTFLSTDDLAKRINLEIVNFGKELGI